MEAAWLREKGGSEAKTRGRKESRNQEPWSEQATRGRKSELEAEKRRGPQEEQGWLVDQRGYHQKDVDEERRRNSTRRERERES